MNTEQAYNSWASQYDTNINRTRDLEARALRGILADIDFENCLEIGCGTGKNSVWLIEKAKQVTAVDLSEEMLAKAKEKIAADNINFIQADITLPWTFGHQVYNMVTYSLVLEHIADLDPVFKETTLALKQGGYVYIGELHPFKQYSGSKARFDTENGQQVVDCFTHHITDFTNAAKKYGLQLVGLNEYFDEDNRDIPRILTLLFQKK